MRLTAWSIRGTEPSTSIYCIINGFKEFNCKLSTQLNKTQQVTHAEHIGEKQILYLSFPSEEKISSWQIK